MDCGDGRAACRRLALRRAGAARVHAYAPPSMIIRYRQLRGQHPAKRLSISEAAISLNTRGDRPEPPQLHPVFRIEDHVRWSPSDLICLPADRSESDRQSRRIRTRHAENSGREIVHRDGREITRTALRSCLTRMVDGNLVIADHWIHASAAATVAASISARGGTRGRRVKACSWWNRSSMRS
jgi:hypothetical protein